VQMALWRLIEAALSFMTSSHVIIIGPSPSSSMPVFIFQHVNPTLSFLSYSAGLPRIDLYLGPERTV